MSTSTSRLLLQNSSILTSTSSYRNENRPVAWYHFSLSFDSSKVLISIVCYSSSQHDDMQLRRDLLHDGLIQNLGSATMSKLLLGYIWVKLSYH